MKNVKKGSFKVVGLSKRTLNAPGKAEVDIPQLWEQFMRENPGEKIAGNHSDEIYCVYYDYEGDHLQPYSVLIGYKVDSDATTVNGLEVIEIPESDYAVFNAEGNLKADAVYNAWLKIWESPINRTFQADFEVYGEEAMNPEDGKIDIFIGVN